MTLAAIDTSAAKTASFFKFDPPFAGPKDTAPLDFVALETEPAQRVCQGCGRLLSSPTPRRWSVNVRDLSSISGKPVSVIPHIYDAYMAAKTPIIALVDPAG